MPVKNRKKNASKAARPAAESPNKLISIRIPEKTIEDLQRQAGKKGGIGYQKLIKEYIASGLAEEAGAGDLSGNTAIFEEETHAIGTIVPKTLPKKKKEPSDIPAVMREDIEALGKIFKPYSAFFAGKTFLITGAFGFLGRYMVHLLHHMNEKYLDVKCKALLLDNFVTGYEQQIVSDEHLAFHRHDVIKPFQTDAKIDYIIHAAGIASPVYYTKFPIETMDVGTQGTRNMLELARVKSVKSFIFMSSSEVYGDPDPKHVPTKEDYNGNVSVNGPRSCYDESKRFGETMCTAYWRVYNVPVKIVRPFNVYGPGIRPDDYRVLPNFIEHALRKEPLPVHGDGRNTRSFCYINDEIEAIFKILFSEHDGEAFNVGNPGPELSVKQLAELVAAAMPHKVKVVGIDPPHAVYANSDPKRRCPDITKLTKLTGFKPRVGLKEGLKRTIRWFQES
jgi:UDP-glucuronate decarboxylase